VSRPLDYYQYSTGIDDGGLSPGLGYNDPFRHAMQQPPLVAIVADQLLASQALLYADVDDEDGQSLCTDDD